MLHLRLVTTDLGEQRWSIRGQHKGGRAPFILRELFEVAIITRTSIANEQASLCAGAWASYVKMAF